MTTRHLATDEPLLEDAVLLLVIAGGVLELALSLCLIWALFAGG